jgi:hypothetical protein
MQSRTLWKGFAVVAFCLFASVAAIGQRVVTNCNGRLVQDSPTGIVLLTGYKNERCIGRDSYQGRIWQDQGLEIRYEGGLGAGYRVSNASNLAWSREHTTGTSRVQVGLTKDRVFLVTFSPLPTTKGPRLDFYATVRGEEDIADMLLMVMAYRP